MASRTETDAAKKLLHFLDLNEYGLNQVVAEERGDAKREVADYLRNEVIRLVNNGVSPVKGEGRFRILDPKYAKNFKGGLRTANLELEGDLKESFKVEPSDGAFIKFGHEGTQVPKADGHNQISSKAQTWANNMRDPKEGTLAFPKRRYIPDSNQKFIGAIEKEIRAIIKDFKSVSEGTATLDLDDIDLLSTVGTTTSSTAAPSELPKDSFVTIDNLFSDDVIDALLQDAIRRR